MSSPKTDDTGFSSVCVECGKINQQTLYKRYTGGSIQLSQCENCHHFIDRYCEVDAVVLLLDVFLLKLQAYRHLLFNYSISTSLLWRLVVALVLCGAYINSRLDSPHTDNFVLLQIHFHLSLVHSLIEFTVITCLSFVVLVSLKQETIGGLCLQILKVIVVSGFVKFFAVITLVWVDDFFVKFLLFLTLPTQFRAYQAVCPVITRRQLVCVVVAQAAFLFAVNLAMISFRTSAFQYLQAPAPNAVHTMTTYPTS